MVDDVQGLEAAVGLRSLVLTFNELTSMEGLTPLTRLTCLDLSFNAITRIQALKVNPDVAQLGLERGPADVYGLISVSLHGQSQMAVSMSFYVCVKWPNVYRCCYA